MPKMALIVVLITAVATPASVVQAQERTERRTLLQMLFGTPKRVEPPPPPRRTPRARKSTSGSVTTIATTPAAPSPATKLDNARKVLVVGDFFADGIADGLAEAFEQVPAVVVEKRSNGSSGLVRDDYYDWRAELPGILTEVQPAVVVVELGANDRQQITMGEIRADFRTDEWLREYERRIESLTRIAASRNIPLLWVGLPSFQSPRMTADALSLNGIYRAHVEKAGGEFIDIWEGFVDQEGRFVLTGSDIKGQQVRLRGSDGINMTAAGKRKMAFYVEKSVRRHLGDLTAPELARLDASNLPELVSLPPSEMKVITHTPPIDLSDPELDGGAVLLGDAPLTVSSIIPSARDRLVEGGETLTAQPGRVDDYRLENSTDSP